MKRMYIPSRKRFYAFFLLFLILLSMPIFVKAEETTERRHVRVAFPEQAGMSYVGHTGKVTGYNYDYLEKISEYTGWEMEYVVYPSEDGNEAVSNAINDLMEGKVDLLGPLLKNDATEEMFEFPEHSYGTVYTTLCASLTGDLTENNVRSRVIKVGLWKQAETRNEEVRTFLKAENMKYTITYYETAEEQEEALRNGEVDVISALSLSPITNTRIVEKFAARPYYFAATKGNTDLIEELDATIERINSVQPRLQDDLFNRYFRDAEDVFLMSEAQEKALSTVGTLRVLCIDDDAPYVYEENGEPKGAVVSVLEDYCAEVGVTPRYTFCNSRDEANALLEEENFDLLIGMPFTSGFCAEHGFVKSEPILTSALAFVKNPSVQKQDSVAIVSGLEDLVDLSSFKKVVSLEDAKACIKAVNDNTVDVAIGDRSIMEYYIYDTNSMLSTSLITGGAQSVCVAVSKDCPTALTETLNNYIYSLSDMAITGYLNEGNTHPDTDTLQQYIRMHPMEAAALIVVITALIAVGISMILYGVKLRRKNEELRVANEAKTEFLSRMSHDIRTPMNGILGMLHLADEFADDPSAVHDCVKKIRTASEYLLSLLNDVLDMRRLDGEDIRLHEDSVHLDELAHSCVSMLETQAADKGVQMDTAGLDGFTTPWVLTDEQGLRRIFMNILGNAVKYTKQGGSVKVSAEVTEQTEESVTCAFTVADTGVGMSEEFQAHMFEPFAQENGGARSVYHGTGLGLSIVKSILDRMGGKIRVESEPNCGTLITWTMRFKVDAAHELSVEKEEPQKADLSGMKILAAEDNALSAEILELVLTNAGAEVVIAENGEQAVEQFENSVPGTFDLILMDIMMPVMDGYTACRRIRSMVRPDAETVPIFAMTANTYPEDIKASEEAGMNAHIGKPLDIAKLLIKIQESARK